MNKSALALVSESVSTESRYRWVLRPVYEDVTATCTHWLNVIALSTDVLIP